MPEILHGSVGHMEKSKDKTSLEEINRITEAIIGAAIQVHREIGPGMLESAYEACLACELHQHGW